MTTETMVTLDPKLLAFWTRCIRETAHWSQEALVASSGLVARTIQRIEAEKPASVTTRRALARGLGYKNPNVFDDPDWQIGAQGAILVLVLGVLISRAEACRVRKTSLRRCLLGQAHGSVGIMSA